MMQKPPLWWYVGKSVASLIVAAAVVTGAASITRDPAFPQFLKGLLDFAKDLCPALVIFLAGIFLLIPWSAWKETDEAANDAPGEREGEVGE